jgi:hypothetical protein
MGGLMGDEGNEEREGSGEGDREGQEDGREEGSGDWGQEEYSRLDSYSE